MYFLFTTSTAFQPTTPKYKQQLSSCHLHLSFITLSNNTPQTILDSQLSVTSQQYPQLESINCFQLNYKQANKLTNQAAPTIKQWLETLQAECVISHPPSVYRWKAVDSPFIIQSTLID
jgi:hypothetical protein